ncbi:protein kinase [Gordonia sp. TBRC 11910]|uniref:Serine/threonine-protein kinase PknK n=1 Tax=Gordonia asplenii TaxID=2725283 RepID=A0A848KT35_9ACTN|nr:serine/threonine-protein kinase [Gordonia asplenii]NMO01620.1 protein kinase [Gordonia asplenii]
MAEDDLNATQQAAAVDVVAELADAGFAAAEAIGHGGFGVVYRCEQPSLDRTVAVKVMTDHLEDTSVERFLREQRAMGRLSGHPNIVNILEVGTTPSGMPFIVMPYHRNDSLDAAIRTQGPLDAAEVLRIGVKIAGAIEAAHRSGTLHRDLKPANILLSEYGEPELCDFGIARVTGGFETGSDIVTGSPAFLAPELMTGAEPSVASDVYGLGATLFCALTGHAAFERRSGEKVIAHFVRVAGQALPNLRDKGIAPEVSAAIEAAMAREPEERPASAYAFGELLQHAQRALGLPVDEMAVPNTAESTIGGTSSGATGRGSASKSLATQPSMLTQPATSSGPITAPPVPATKFHPPVRPRVQVRRDRLMNLLRAGERRRLVVIHAPAGYGKTTVAAQWAEALMDDGVTVAWLTVDDDDNNQVWFLAHIIQSLTRSDPRLTDGLADLLEEHGENAQKYVLTSLINTIHTRKQQVAVVIDDWHRVTDPGAQSAFDFLLEHGCHHLQIIITSRWGVGLPLSKMRVRDELVEIDISGLCFDATETHDFLVDAAGLDLATTDIHDLCTATDGWVAALQLASVSLRGSGSPSDLIGHISGRHQAIGDFLAENVLSSLDEQMLKFLLATSVTEQVCASLATALSGRSRGQALLEEIEARDLFLRRVDPGGEWFAYYPLFAEFLRRRLERDYEELLIPLHRKASAWFAEHDMLSQAVQHALAAGDAETAADLIERRGQDLIEQSAMHVLHGLIDKLPADVVDTRPRLLLLVAWCYGLIGRADAALAVLDRVAAVADLADDIRCSADVIRAVVDALADRTDRIDELIDEIMSRPEGFSPFYASAAGNLAAISALARFDFEESHRWLEWAEPFHERNTGSYASMYGHAMDGLAWFEQLDLDAAEEQFRAALTAASTTGQAHAQSGRLASAMLAQILYERGKLGEASQLLDESFRLTPEEGAVDTIIARYVIGARLATLRGDTEEAASCLDDAVAIGERSGARRLVAAVECEQVIQGVPTRRRVRPRITFAERRKPESGFAEVARQYEHETAIRLLLNDSESFDTACQWAADWVDYLSDTGRERALLRAQRLLAVCLLTAGRVDEGRAVAAAVVVRCAEVGMMRFAVDGGKVLRESLNTFSHAQH